MTGAQGPKRKFNRSKEIKMFGYRYFILLGSAALLLVVLLTVQQAFARPAAVSDMDSAAQSYSAWAKAAEVENIDSATRSYRAWALEVEGAVIPLTGNAESPDYHQRHSEQPETKISPIDECFDVSLSEVAACREASQSPSQ
jgi:hypothetical protein